MNSETFGKLHTTCRCTFLKEYSMNAECVELTYHKAVWETTESYSRQCPGYFKRVQKNYPKHVRVYVSGGWIYARAPSNLVLSIKVDSKIHEIAIGDYFKKNLGRLTKKRQKLLCETMPTQVHVQDQNEDTMQVNDRDLESWLCRVRLCLK